MEATSSRAKSRLLFIILSLGLIIGGQTWARTTTLDHEQATLVSKFAKYVTWPTEARQREFVIGVYDDAEKYTYFSNFFANKGIRGKDILVRLVKTTSEAEEVNILYVPSLNQNRFIKLADKVSGSHVLIISENSKYNQNTMVDISYNEDDAKIVLKVNDDAIKAEQLMIPELSYFTDDKKDEEILTISPTALKKQRTDQLAKLQKDFIQQKEILESLETQTIQQKNLLDELNQKLSLSKDNAEKQELTLQKNAVRLKLSEQENEKKNQEIKAQEKKLQQLEKQLKTQQAQLENTPQNEKDDNFEEQSQADAQAINELTEKLKKQEGITNNTLKKVTVLTDENKSLASFQTLFYVVLLIAIIALVIAYLMWKKTLNATTQTLIKSDVKKDPLLPVREKQLINSENLAALGYVATDVTYAASLALDELKHELDSIGDTKNAAKLNPVLTLLDNFNVIAADQDDTKIQSFDIITYIKNMMMLFDLEFSQSDITYNYSGENTLVIKSVPSFIAIVLLNLINNSLKHGFDNKGKGKITLKVDKSSKNGAKITYTDNGKGMNKAILKQVFEPFFTTRNDRGYVGVGMSTTYDLIKNKLAGDISIESQEGKGTTVTITLP